MIKIVNRNATRENILLCFSEIIYVKKSLYLNPFILFQRQDLLDFQISWKMFHVEAR